MTEGQSLGAKVIVEFTFKNVCDQGDLDSTDMSLDEMVRWLIQEEGLFGVCEDEFTIREVVPASSQGTTE